ncbi:MAG TPA: twin-arginine translocase TatA/TatE family subunit [Blastocatellia bacterium]|nr:twin-arginine translocase TatA/TatE family subunit [Blastocatellia bacterium]
MGDLGLPELLVLAVLLILLFGARRIPEAMRGLGEGIRSFKSGLRERDVKVYELPARHDEAKRRQSVS